MRRVIASLATSADGFIARPNGGVEWLGRSPTPAGDYGMIRFTRSVDTVVMGRKTWDLTRRLGRQFEPGQVVYVFTRLRPRRPIAGVTFVREPIPRFADRIRRDGGRDVWLMGGAELFAGFLDAGEIDELVLHVVPTLIGAGIPLFAPRHRDIQLRLRGCRRFADGVVRLTYIVPRVARRPLASSRPRLAGGAPKSRAAHRS